VPGAGRLVSGARHAALRSFATGAQTLPASTTRFKARRVVLMVLKKKGAAEG